MDREHIFSMIEAERHRQNEIHPRTKVEDMPLVLTEEFLEVLRAMQGEGDLEEELVQVAAVVVRWLEKF